MILDDLHRIVRREADRAELDRLDDPGPGRDLAVDPAAQRVVARERGDDGQQRRRLEQVDLEEGLHELVTGGQLSPRRPAHTALYTAVWTVPVLRMW